MSFYLKIIALLMCLIMPLSNFFYRGENKEFEYTDYEKISKECDSFQRKTTISNSSLFSDSKLTTLTGISAEDIVKLNKSEKLLLLLLTVGVDNTGMAVLFNTTADSIRNRKSQLKKKLNQYQIQLNQPINE